MTTKDAYQFQRKGNTGSKSPEAGKDHLIRYSGIKSCSQDFSFHHTSILGNPLIRGNLDKRKRGPIPKDFVLEMLQGRVYLGRGKKSAQNNYEFKSQTLIGKFNSNPNARIPCSPRSDTVAFLTAPK